jgi:multiple sugar transport system ATP-binding protein
MASVRLEQVEKVFPNGQAAVRGLSLEVADGELLVLVGPSGCGKTTTLRLIAGLEEPTAGRIYIGERDVTEVPPHRRDVAMVFQNYALYPHLTVRQNLGFGLRMRGTSPAVIAERVRGVARSLGIEAHLDAKPGQLSGGQRQNVALWRAIVREPRAFLLDEPLSNLDAVLRAEMRMELARLHHRLGATMIHVTHDQAEAMTLGNRVAVLRAGRIEQIGSPTEVYCRPANQFVAGFIGSPSMNFLWCTLHGGRVESPWFTLPVEGDGGPREVTLGVRPQDIRIGDEGDALGRVEVIQPLGSELHVLLTLMGGSRAHSVMVVVPPDGPEVRAGQTVRLRFARERLHLFDPATGARIEVNDRR